jgi:hypothetical protein
MQFPYHQHLQCQMFQYYLVILLPQHLHLLLNPVEMLLLQNYLNRLQHILDLEFLRRLL